MKTLTAIQKARIDLRNHPDPSETEFAESAALLRAANNLAVVQGIQIDSVGSICTPAQALATVSKYIASVPVDASFLTATALAKVLGCRRPTIMKHLRAGRIPAVCEIRRLVSKRCEFDAGDNSNRIAKPCRKRCDLTCSGATTYQSTFDQGRFQRVRDNLGLMPAGATSHNAEMTPTANCPPNRWANRNRVLGINRVAPSRMSALNAWQLNAGCAPAGTFKFNLPNGVAFANQIDAMGVKVYWIVIHQSHSPNGVAI